MALDRKTIRTLIVDLREGENMSFEDIRDTMEELYGYKASRQAVCGIYNRAKEAMKRKPQKDLAKQTLGVNVANLLARGYTMTTLEKDPKKFALPEKCGRWAMSEALELVPGLREQAYENIVDELRYLLMSGAGLQKMKKAVRYGKTPMTNKAFVQAVADAYVPLVQAHVAEFLKEEYALHGDKDIVQETLAKLNLGIPVHQVCGSDFDIDDSIRPEDVVDGI